MPKFYGTRPSSTGARIAREVETGTRTGFNLEEQGSEGFAVNELLEQADGLVEEVRQRREAGMTPHEEAMFGYQAGKMVVKFLEAIDMGGVALPSDFSQARLSPVAAREKAQEAQQQWLALENRLKRVFGANWEGYKKGFLGEYAFAFATTLARQRLVEDAAATGEKIDGDELQVVYPLREDDMGQGATDFFVSLGGDKYLAVQVKVSRIPTQLLCDQYEGDGRVIFDVNKRVEQRRLLSYYVGSDQRYREMATEIKQMQDHYAQDKEIHPVVVLLPSPEQEIGLFHQRYGNLGRDLKLADRVYNDLKRFRN